MWYCVNWWNYSTSFCGTVLTHGIIDFYFILFLFYFLKSHHYVVVLTRAIIAQVFHLITMWYCVNS